MGKNKLDFKLINLAIWVFILYLILQIRDVLMEVVLTLKQILLPFFMSFILAYIIYPLLLFLERWHIPKWLGIILIILFGILIIILGSVYIIPNFIAQLIDIISNLFIFVKQLSERFNLDYTEFANIIFEKLNNTIFNFIKVLTVNIYNITTSSIGVMTKGIIIISTSLYLVLDMDRIRYRIKNSLKKYNLKIYTYVKMLDSEMKNYLIGFSLIMIITFFEYLIGYLIIGHPNYLILSFLASLGNLIPCFGGMIGNVISLVISLVIGPSLFVKNIILSIILSNIDSYVINPVVYGKTSKIPPVLIILSVFVGGVLFGTLGVIFSMPLIIIVVSSYRFFKDKR